MSNLLPRGVFRFSPLFRSGGASNYRIPNVIVTAHGSLLAFCNDRRNDIDDRSPEHWVVMRRSEDWLHFGEEQILFARKDWSAMLGNVFYDEIEGRILCLFTCRPNSAEEIARVAALPESERPYAGHMIAESLDDGRSFTLRPFTMQPNALGFSGATHGSAAGIQLRRGPHAGRLVSCARYHDPSATGMEDHESQRMLQNAHWNCSVYSDDHGRTWRTGGPVQVGTGEGALVELPDGTLLLNSRAYWNDGRRRVAYSADGGESFGRFGLCEDITEPNFGVNAAMVSARLPDGREILVYTSLNNRAPDADGKPFRESDRRNLSAWVSFDEGERWPLVRTLWAGPSAYSSLAFDFGTQRFAALIEYGEEGERCYGQGIGLCVFDANWLLGVEKG